MKKKLLILSLLALPLVAACTNSSVPTSAPTSTPTSVPTSEPTSAPTSTTTSEPSSSTTVEEGPLTIGETSRAMPVYEYAGGVYTFHVSAVKTGCSLSGTLNGSIKVVVDAGLEAYENIQFDLSGVTINSTSGSPISYEGESKKVVLKAAEETTNVIKYTGEEEKMSAISSSNNVEISGKGTIEIASTTGHAVKAEEIVLNAKTKIKITGAGQDGLHCKELIMNDEGDDFKGTLSIKNVAKQAIDVANDYKNGLYGVITWPGEATPTIEIDGATNVFTLDASMTIPSNVAITAVNVSGNAVANDSKTQITVTVEGTLSVNGQTLSTFDVAGK